MSEVIDNPAQHRFELAIDGSEDAGEAYYRIEDNRVVLTHTIVPQTFSGQGIGSHLARGVFDATRASGRKAVLRCPFMGAFYARHHEYSDIVVG
ncbi:acetyltransferase [Skermanella stibiiresistens SB22]|uniref:Acetyltransferase n=1 Tax=Skermanella stibiiresistens SB22 TaxID=1385369 RepID=W9GQM0_9PROT|nr:GNAT family N-acetyltransferase [Skermanella stibiiresistens]EWY36079.1 acetyltransferase [Skermanella stibiiresistens SB22]